MVSLTLISEPQAVEGGRFYYFGPQPECNDCKLKKVCIGIDKGSLYEIVAVRDQTHDCAVSEDKVKVVEVRKVAQISAVPKKSAIEGGVITFRTPDCSRLDCGNYRLCHPYAVEDGMKYTVTEIEEGTGCPVDKDLIFVKLL